MIVSLRYSLAPSQWATTVWGAWSPTNQDISLKISGHSGVYPFRKGSMLMLYGCFKETCDVWSFVEVAVIMRRWLSYPVTTVNCYAFTYSLQSHGVPQFFGVYYGLGFALIFQSLLSSFHHFCQNGSNYGFGELRGISTAVISSYVWMVLQECSL